MWSLQFAPLALALGLARARAAAGRFARVAAMSAVTSLALLPLRSLPAFAQETTLDALRASAKARPADPEAALALGRALRRAGHFADALSSLSRGVALAPAKSDVLRRLRWEIARSHVDGHDLPRAMAACKKLGDLPGQQADGHACGALAYLIWQRATEALAETELAFATDPGNYAAHVAAGYAFELSLEPKEAEADYRAAVAAGAPSPDSVDAQVHLGHLLVHEGRHDEGVSVLRSAVQADPSGPDALFELGTALGPAPESVDLLGRATAERPTFPEAWLALGNGLLRAGALDRARQASIVAVKQDPGSVAAIVLSGRVALGEGRVDDALAAGKAATKIVANNAAAVLLVADAYARKGDVDSAVEAYQAAWGFDHRDPWPLVHASEICHGVQRDTTARAFGAKAVEEFPNYAPAWAALGDALVGQKEPALARDAYRKALSVGEGAIDRAAVQGKLSALQ
jgi:tetratricopeptide (TPR) repeat protein